MKKSIVVLAFMVFGFAAFSQDTMDWKFSVNISPMLTRTSASERIESNGSRMGLEFSLHAEHYFKERYAYFAGLSFMSVGGTVRNNGEENLDFRTDGFTLAPGQDAKLRLQYLTIPVGLKFKTPDYGMLAYYFQTALFPGVRIGGSGSKFNKPSESLSKDFNAMTFGLQLGAGAMYSTGDATYLKFGLSYNYFFVDALRAGNMNAKPMGFGLNLGFLF